MQDLIQKHRAEREMIRARLYAIDQERKQLRRREIELGGVIAALETVAQQQMREEPTKPTARPATPADDPPAEQSPEK